MSKWNCIEEKKIVKNYKCDNTGKSTVCVGIRYVIITSTFNFNEQQCSLGLS